MDTTETLPPVSVKLSGDLIARARREAAAQRRSLTGQIEYILGIGFSALDNPDIPPSLVQDILISRQEFADGLGQPYQFKFIDPNS